MINWGINALNHDASIAVIDNELKFWKRSSEYSNVPRDDKLNKLIIDDAILKGGYPDKIFWYEQPWIKKTRQLYAGQYSTAFDMSNLPSKHLKDLGLDNVPVTYVPHHASHASAGYYTSPFKNAAIVVIDAIGEWECVTIWHGTNNELKKVWSRSYPHSVGLFYSAFTQLIGFKPIEQEFLLQQAAEQGDWRRYHHEVSKYWKPNLKARWNLHRGVLNWPYEIVNLQDQCDIAAAVQKVFEQLLSYVLSKAQELTNEENLVYVGGCAFNKQANSQVINNTWRNVWIPPNPGDSSSSIGAILYNTKEFIKHNE